VLLKNFIIIIVTFHYVRALSCDCATGNECFRIFGPHWTLRRLDHRRYEFE